MPTDDNDGDDESQQRVDTGTLTVAMPRELLREIDAFATHNGYESPDAVVAAALAHEDDPKEQ